MTGKGSAHLGLGRAMRLKQAREFARVRQSGERLVTGCLIANWLKQAAGWGQSRPTSTAAGWGQPSPAFSRLGVVTSSRIGSAVVRSRARRLLREAFRQHQHDLTDPVDLVLVARPSISGKAFAAVEKDFLTTMRKAGLLKGQGKR